MHMILFPVVDIISCLLSSDNVESVNGHEVGTF